MHHTIDSIQTAPTELTAYCDVDCAAAAPDALTPVHPAAPSDGHERARVRLVRDGAPIGVIPRALSHFLTCRKVHELPRRRVCLGRRTADGEALPSEELLAAWSQTWKGKRQFLGTVAKQQEVMNHITRLTQGHQPGAATLHHHS